MKDQPSRWRRTVIVLTGVVTLLDLIEAVYHLTHAGLRSGIIQSVMAVLLPTLVYLFLKAGQKGDREKLQHYGMSALAVVGLAISILLYLGPYHLTTGGIRSGVIELGMAGLLMYLG